MGRTGRVWMRQGLSTLGFTRQAMVNLTEVRSSSQDPRLPTAASTVSPENTVPLEDTAQTPGSGADGTPDAGEANCDVAIALRHGDTGETDATLLRNGTERHDAAAPSLQASLGVRAGGAVSAMVAVSAASTSFLVGGARSCTLRSGQVRRKPARALADQSGQVKLEVALRVPDADSLTRPVCRPLAS